MNKKGFTLVELLAVLVLIIVVGSIGTVGVIALNRNIKKSLWNGKIDLIESEAKNYGEDNKLLLKNNCFLPDGSSKTACLTIKVSNLIEENYLKTKEVNDDNEKVITNDTLEKDDMGYYVNDLDIYIYLENERVYAKLNYSEE